MKNPVPKVVISVERFVNLTMPLADKMEKADANMGRYTVFVNKKHNLAHVVAKGDNIIFRVPISQKKLKREIDAVVETYFTVRLRLHLLGF